jgi:uncharacterized protein involved in type VI secretion and phage assembly
MEGTALERLVVELADQLRGRFYGKYRGIVTDVGDPDQLGRIKANVPEVLGDEESPWALPCVPFAGKDHGVVWLPEAGDGVWIEFEAGDPARPLWCGGWWGDGDLSDVANAKVRAFVTSAGHKIVIDDDQNLIHLEHASGGTVDISDSDITLQSGSGKVVLDASGVSVNDGALMVS